LDKQAKIRLFNLKYRFAGEKGGVKSKKLEARKNEVDRASCSNIPDVIVSDKSRYN
jgi:hypothetical protein